MISQQKLTIIMIFFNKTSWSNLWWKNHWIINWNGGSIKHLGHQQGKLFCNLINMITWLVVKYIFIINLFEDVKINIISICLVKYIFLKNDSWINRCSMLDHLQELPIPPPTLYPVLVYYRGEDSPRVSPIVPYMGLFCCNGVKWSSHSI
jgi:hypothetical protein